MMIKHIRNIALKSIALIIGLSSVTTLFAIGISNTAGAADARNFHAGRIIDDSVFYKSTSMSASQIQTFLNSKVPVCDTSGLQNSEMNNSGVPDYNKNGSIQRWEWGKAKYNQTKFPCLKDYSQNTPATEAASGLCGALSGGIKSSAKIIYDVARACGINPQVLLVLLQKEQSLVTDTWPLTIQYKSATGFDCPDTAPCDPQFAGFYYQVYNAARQFRVYKAYPNDYNYIAGRTNNIYWHPDLARCGSSQVFIQTQATAALYIYTPYRPNTAALNNLYGTGDSCSSYGNRNFWRMFVDWFGTTYGSIYGGFDYFNVFDELYYLNKYPDVKAAVGNVTGAALAHFVNYGMKEGRQAKAEFNVFSYKNRYKDLRRIFENNLKLYYKHYTISGKAEGRLATGTPVISYITDYRGFEYADVYNYSTYMSTHPDLNALYKDNDAGAMTHFINYGMGEGRQAKAEFNVFSYKNRYPDLRRIFGNNLKAYYLHYINYGKKEGRIATGNEINGTSILGNINYSAVYNFSYYISRYSDLRRIFGIDDIAAIKHFVNVGMGEGRQASSEFNVQIYKNNYSDLRQAFGNNLKAYYLHYINYGKSEGRVAI